MTASESSVIGLAKQTGKGTENTTDASFTYFLFNRGSGGPQPIVLPLDQEVGGGALLRDMVKVGVMSGGGFEFIPRPTILGHMLTAALGTDTVTGSGPDYSHAIKMGADQFSAPYYTMRMGIGNIHGEIYQDARIAGLSLNWRSPDFVRATCQIMGGLPKKAASMGSWAPATYLDGGPQFLTPVSYFEVPTSTAIKVLQGSVNFGLAVPMDQQWIAGSYSPDDFDINQRSVTFQFLVKITDTTLYTKVAYDPAGGTAWVVDMLREADIRVEFQSDRDAAPATPYSLIVTANGDNQASGTANVVWQATPVDISAGRQLTYVLTGTVIADPTAGDPVVATLVNTDSTDYDA